MTPDEGYIKFKANWQNQPAPIQPVVKDLMYWRQLCYHNKWIGAYPNNIGYGNISMRINNSEQFWITGSATGLHSTLTTKHFSKVCKVNIKTNQLWCEGPIIASSESMSHAVIYKALSWVNSVIHVHQLEAWQRLIYHTPTTPRAISYGTPEMANAILDLFQKEENVQQKIFTMAGHREGIFSFGESLEDAFETLNKAIKGNELDRL